MNFRTKRNQPIIKSKPPNGVTRAILEKSTPVRAVVDSK